MGLMEWETGQEDQLRPVLENHGVCLSRDVFKVWFTHVSVATQIVVYRLVIR